MNLTASAAPNLVPEITVAKTPIVPTKKPFHVVADEYISCLLAEVIAYQKRDTAYRTLTNCPIPDRDLKAAIGQTNSAHDVFRARRAEEVEAHPWNPSPPPAEEKKAV